MTDKRKSPIEISQEDFKKIGYQLVDSIANFIDTINENQLQPEKLPNKYNSY